METSNQSETNEKRIELLEKRLLSVESEIVSLHGIIDLMRADAKVDRLMNRLFSIEGREPWKGML